MIEVENLTKTYGGNHTAVRGLSFRVPSGQICGFLGPNGAGKSTTLRMLTGYLSPTEGAIRIGGIDALADPIEARRKIGYMPEACPLYPEMRVREYLRYRAELKGVPRKRVSERVDASLAQAAVADVADRIIGQLSKGYRQRVGLADALVADPPLLVLDEPTAGLDPNQIRQVRALVQTLAKDKTVLLSTHILPEVEAICDRILILHKGVLVSDGEPDRLRRTLRNRQAIAIEARGAQSAVEAALRAIEALRVIEIDAQGEGDAAIVRATLEAADDPDVTEAIFRAFAKAGLALREMRRQDVSLEDVFTDLTTAEPAAEPEDDDADADEDEDADADEEEKS